MSNDWYYFENNSPIGPVERGELERLISQSLISPQTLVWRDGLNSWEEANRHFDFSGNVSGHPRVTPREYSNATEQVAKSGELYPAAPARNFGEAISTCFTKYATFLGRASRSEYWYFFLFSIIMGFVTGFIDIILFGIDNSASPINLTFSLIVFLPSLAVAWRRLHDTNRSGWWVGSFWLVIVVYTIIDTAIVSNTNSTVMLLCFLILLIYAFILLFFLVQKGSLGPNRFG